MDWEIVILGEIIQREKDNYDCLYVESKKNGTIEFIYKTEIETQI